MPNCFSGLNVSEMRLTIHGKPNLISKNVSFEEVFNNTQIDQLHLYGSVLSPSNSSLIQISTRSIIRSLTLHRTVDRIDTMHYPNYATIDSYTIHSIGAHSMNLSSFVPFYQNLRRLEILQPRFDVFIDQFLPSLDSLTIDVEEFSEKTVFAARHISSLKFGPRLRRFDSKIFSSTLFFRRLRFLDLSDVNLSELTSESRCSLMEYLQKYLHHQLNIRFPKLDPTHHCQCAELFLLHFLYPSTDFHHSTCPQQCQLTDCSIIRDYFREKYSSNRMNVESLQTIELDEENFNEHLFPFIFNPTEKYPVESVNRTENSTGYFDSLNVFTLENLQEYDEMIPLTTIESSFDPTRRKESMINLIVLITIGWIFLLIFLLIIVILFILTIRSRRQQRSKSVPVHL